MLKFQWNALRHGDRVLVHDTDDPEFTLLSGEVVIVDTVVGSTNELAVRLDASAEVVRPQRLTVHLDPIEANEGCWRCDAVPLAGTRAA